MVLLTAHLLIRVTDHEDAKRDRQSQINKCIDEWVCEWMNGDRFELEETIPLTDQG